MFPLPWRGWLNQFLSRGKKGTAPIRRNPILPTLEQLEDRTVPALIGSEFHVNTATSGEQANSANASSANGLSVVVWTHRVSSNNIDIRAQMYDVNRNKLGGEIVVANSFLNENAPAVAMDNIGDWKVVWTETSGSNMNVIAARFASTGVRLGANIIVANSLKKEYDPSVAVNSVGDFVVSYTLDFTTTNQDVSAKMYTDAGTLLSTIIVGATPADERRSAVARSTGASGVFVVAYQVGEDIFLNRYSAGGLFLNRLGIATGSTRQIRPSVAMDDVGASVVAFQAFVGGDWEIFARKVTNTGALTATFTVSNATSNEINPAVTMDRSDGEFAVTYQVGTSVFVREMNSGGVGIGAAILVAVTGSSTSAPAISINGSDFYLITYTTLNRPDDSGGGIFGRFGLLQGGVSFP